MDVGNAARLACRFAPELLDNEKSLAHAITKLRAQVPAIERNGPLSGTALPAWLLRALTDVANNSDAVVESQAMHEQVNGLQKEVLELRHELLLQQSAMSAAASTGGFNPTPHPRLSTGSSIRGIAARRASVSTKKLSTGDPTETTAEATAASLSSDAEQFNMELVLKPLWEAIHKQTNALSALKQNFTEAKVLNERAPLQTACDRIEWLCKMNKTPDDGIALLAQFTADRAHQAYKPMNYTERHHSMYKADLVECAQDLNGMLDGLCKMRRR